MSTSQLAPNLAPKPLPTLQELALKTLKAHEFHNLQPNDPLHGLNAFLGVATVCISEKTYTINVPAKLESTSDGMKKTLSVWEEARKGFSLKDKSAPIFVIYISSSKLFLRIGFPRMNYADGQVLPLGGHIDLAAKQPCIAAGQVLFTKPGEAFAVKDIDNQSGHYQPTEVEVGGELVKSPRTVTALAFRLALGVPDVEKIYRDPQDEERKAKKLQDEKLEEKSADFGKAMPAEEKLLALYKDIQKAGGFAFIKQRNYNKYVQQLANVVARAKWANQATSHINEVQTKAKSAFENSETFSAAVLMLVSHFAVTTALRPLWIEGNVPD
jgi:hypothetical protein